HYACNGWRQSHAGRRREDYRREFRSSERGQVASSRQGFRPRSNSRRGLRPPGSPRVVDGSIIGRGRINRTRGMVRPYAASLAGFQRSAYDLVGGRPAPPNFWLQPSPSISPDGSLIAFWAPDESGKIGLWIRSLSSPVARMLPGTNDQGEGGLPACWSPD